MMRKLSDSVFFFQAEDGIRDYKVTGVQTCALPIYRSSPAWTSRLMSTSAGVERPSRANALWTPSIRTRAPPTPAGLITRADAPTGASDGRGGRREIGRASCRERV